MDQADGHATFRQYLQTALARQYHTRQVNAMVEKFDALAARHGTKDAFLAILEAYGSEDSAAATATIESQLRQLHGQTVDANPVTRIRGYIQRHKKNLAKVSIEVSHPENLEPHQRQGLAEAGVELERVRNPVVPAFADQRPKSLTAYGKHRGREVSLCVLWKT